MDVQNIPTHMNINIPVHITRVIYSPLGRIWSTSLLCRKLKLIPLMKKPKFEVLLLKLRSSC